MIGHCQYFIAYPINQSFNQSMYNGIKEAIKKIESPYLLVGLYSTLKTGEFFSISPRLTASLSLYVNSEFAF